MIFQHGSSPLKKFLFAKFFMANENKNLCFTSIMLQFFYTKKNRWKKKFTSLLFYIRPEQKAAVNVYEAKRLESKKDRDLQKKKKWRKEMKTKQLCH